MRTIRIFTVAVWSSPRKFCPRLWCSHGLLPCCLGHTMMSATSFTDPNNRHWTRSGGGRVPTVNNVLTHEPKRPKVPGADSSRWHRAVNPLGQRLHPNDLGRGPQLLLPGIESPNAPRILANSQHAPSAMENVRSRTGRRDRLF